MGPVWGPTQPSASDHSPFSQVIIAHSAWAMFLAEWAMRALLFRTRGVDDLAEWAMIWPNERRWPNGRWSIQPGKKK